MKRYSFSSVKVLYVALAVMFVMPSFGYFGDSSCNAQSEKIRVACVGNSITYGHGIKNRDRDTYPAVLGRLLGDKYEVGNFGISGRTLMNKGDVPYMKEQIYKDALAFQPNIVTIKLGTNDSKPQNWKFNDTFKDDLRALIRSFQELPTKPKIYLCLPIPCTFPRWEINDSVITNGVIPYIREVAREMNLPIIDLNTAFRPYVHLLPDNVHPNEDGAAVIAQILSQRLIRDAQTRPEGGNRPARRMMLGALQDRRRQRMNNQ